MCGRYYVDDETERDIERLMKLMDAGQILERYGDIYPGQKASVITHEGVMKIARAIAKKVEAEHGRKISLQEAKNILLTNTYKLRGERFDFSEAIREIKKEYLKGLMVLIEQKWPGEIDKSDFITVSDSAQAPRGDSFLFNFYSHHSFSSVRLI